MNLKALLPWIGTMLIDMPSKARAVVAGAIIFLVLGTAWLVYATGGIRFSYSHLIYIPVVLGGFAFGVRGGILAAIAGGVALGPLIPINTSTGETQEPLNWIYRLVFLCINGALTGALSQLFRRYLRDLEWLHEHHEDTGLLNLSGLTRSLDEIIGKAPGGRRLIVSVIQLSAMFEIENTFGAGFGMRLLAQIVAHARQIMPPEALFALIQTDRLGIVINGDESEQSTLERVEAILNES